MHQLVKEHVMTELSPQESRWWRRTDHLVTVGRALEFLVELARAWW